MKTNNNEETRLLDTADNPNEIMNHMDSGIKTRKNGGSNGKVAAVGAGAFVTGGAIGVAATMMADNSEEPPIAADEVVAPSEEQAILANDEGIRYAHVDTDNFESAFAQARSQVGAGGVFEYNGRLYGTYTADEWSGMSAEDKTAYQARVNEVAPIPSRHSEPSPAPESFATPETTHHTGPELTPVAEEVTTEPTDNEIRILGVESLDTNYGTINVALLESDGDQALLVDVDNNGSMDIMMHDDNHDGDIQQSEVYDISEADLRVEDLLAAQAMQEGGDSYLASADAQDFSSDMIDNSNPEAYI